MKKLILVCLLAFTASVYSWGTTSYTWNGTTKVLTITGSGAMEDKSAGSAEPWTGSMNVIEKIIISDGITHIGAFAFDGASKVSEITIPSSVTSIGEKAFKGCQKMAKIYFSGSSDDWACIDFRGNTVYSHPFYDSNTKPRRIYFDGSTSNYADNLVFTSNLTTINKYAFAKTNLTSISIPSSVTSIGEYAFYKDTITEMAINRSTPPTLANTGAIYFSASAKLYVPSNAKSNYNVNSLWRYSTSSGKNGNGVQEANIIEKPVSGTVNGQSWSLNENGVLTISGSGALTTSFKIAAGESQYPYYYFRHLVDKVVVTGGITGLSNILQRCSAVREIEISQDNIPTSTVTTPTDYIYSQITLRVTKNALFSLDPTTTPWSGKKYALSESVTIDQDVNNATLFTALHKLTEPFDMNLTRSMSNEYYNTFCSPIDMDASLVESTFGAGTKIYSFAGTSYDEGMDELSLNFNESQDNIEAGVPYLIWPADAVENPSFANVNPSDVATAAGTVVGDHATFYGALAPVVIPEGGNKNFIFLQADNTLNWASEGTLGGMRAYWLLTTGVPARAMARRPVINIGNDAMGIDHVQSNNVQSTKVLKDGQLYLMYEGRMYDVRGMRVD